VGGGDIAEVSNRIEKPDFRAAFDAAFRASVARRVGFGIHADKVRLAQAHENKRLMDEIRNRDAEIEQLHGEVRIRSTEIERLRAENRNHVAEIGQLLMEIEHLIEQYRAVLVSTSWRLTAPGRLLKTWLIRHIVRRLIARLSKRRGLLSKRSTGFRRLRRDNHIRKQTVPCGWI
jgi:hypothetical protein